MCLSLFYCTVYSISYLLVTHTHDGADIEFICKIKAMTKYCIHTYVMSLFLLFKYIIKTHNSEMRCQENVAYMTIVWVFTHSNTQKLTNALATLPQNYHLIITDLACESLSEPWPNSQLVHSLIVFNNSLISLWISTKLYQHFSYVCSTCNTTFSLK